jgi:RNA polymerase sigma-54 factor
MSGFGMGQGMRLELRPDMKLAPRMILSMKVLLMPTTDLMDKVQEELQDNPFLEQRDEKAKPTEAEPEFNPDGILKNDETGEREFARLDELNKDWNDHFDSDHRPSRGALEEMGDRKLDMMQNLPDEQPSLQDYLMEQLGFMELDPQVQELVEFVISHLDHNGYFLGHDADGTRTFPLYFEDLALNFTPRQVTAGEIEEALMIVQQLDPAGTGARDAKECLMLQVTEETPHAELVRSLIRDGLEDVAYNRLPLIQKRTGHSLETIREAIDELRKLDPKPGSKYTVESTRYVTPDIIVERTDDGDYSVRLTDDWLPAVKLNKKYIGVTKDRTQPKPMRDELKRKLQSAHWLLSAIEQRRHTLIRVTQAIIAHQRDFLDKGPDHIHPLKMEQIAEIVGVHVTTISRAVDDKWVQTPRGVFPLRRFFGGGTKSADGQDIAWETIKQKLLEFIAGEDKKSPLSDEDIVKRFAEAGLTVARRTVTKYREALNIPSSRQRREWTA